MPIFPSLPGARTFLLTKDDSYLLQLQSNRFYRNWRRREDEYPHFDELGESFRTEYSDFQRFLANAELTVPSILQLEVSYINWIQDVPVQFFLRAAEGSHVTVSGVDEWPQDQSWTSRYLVRAQDRTPIARLHVQCVPALRASRDGTVPGNQLSLTFLAPWRTTASFDSYLEELLAKARDAIVRGFTALTTEAAHALWERIQ
jgi:uncharacterized protein (TIGR04255 family)